MKDETALTTQSISQPLLLESQEARRTVDKERTNAINKIEQIEADIESLKLQLNMLVKRRDDLMLIVSGADRFLIVVDGGSESTAVEPRKPAEDANGGGSE